MVLLLALFAAIAIAREVIGMWALVQVSCLVWLLAAPAAIPTIVAHRGASHDAPENTLAAFRLGFARGADAAECDVHLTADGRIVALHDADTARTAGGRKRRVAESSLAALRALDVGGWKAERFAGERIPLLSEILDALPAGKRLLIEVKCGPEILERLQRVLAASGKRDQVVIMSFSLAVVRGVEQRLAAVPAYWLRDAADDGRGGQRPFALELVQRTRRAGLDGLGLHHGGVRPELVAAAHRAGLQVYAWTVDDAAEARRLQRAGVDGLITNRPGWLRRQLASEQR